MTNQPSVEELVADGSATYTVKVPTALLKANGEAHAAAVAGEVMVRPLVMRDVERLSRAAREQRVLASILMVQQALVAPRLTVEQVGLPAGLVQFLSERVSHVSGLSVAEDDLERAVKAPIARASFILAREFGWTLEQCSALTLG